MEQSGGGSAPEPGRRPKAAATVESSGDRIRFRVELVPGETTVVSWKQLQKEANSSNSGEAVTSVTGPLVKPQPPLTSMASMPKQEANDSTRQVGSSRLNNVIERIERMYAGSGSSDDEDGMLDDVPDDDEYDTDDSFIDDTELDDYFKVDTIETKHDGFFVNRGKLEHIEPTISHNQQPRKRRHKDLAKGHGGSDDGNVGNKQVKLGVKGRKESSSMNKNPTSQSLTAAVTDVKVQAFPTNASAVSFPSKNKIDSTTSAQDPAELYAIRQGKNIDLQNVPFIPGIEGSDFDAKNDLLDEAIVELKKIVDEFQPPAKEVHDPDNSSQAVKRRLPREIKLMLAKIARLTEDIFGKMPKHVLLRLMDIVGHLMQLRTLKKHLKVMDESGLSARSEKHEQVRKIRQEVEEMVKLWIPFMKYKVEKLTASSSYFRESGPAEKEDLIRKHSMDDALEDKICDLYELYAERIEENSVLQVKVLYEELAALWPSGFMDTHGIRYAIHRAKERRRLTCNLMKDQANIKKQQTVLTQKPEDSSRAVAINVTQTLLHTRDKHGGKMVHAASPMHVACSNKQKQERVKGSSSSSVIYTMPMDISPKKEVIRKPSTEVEEAQFRLENMQVSQAADGLQKLRKFSDVPLPKSFLRLAPPSDLPDEHQS
ncbi:ubinuclein-1-like [Primulina huaijiensis]|uniref:ubinuclein-1-like n=1 Tax=Primulina huaijiensis TaxID=1492673 RepID=UPI003CC6F7B4